MPRQQKDMGKMPVLQQPIADTLEMVRKSRMELWSAEMAALTVEKKEAGLRDITQIIQEAQDLIKHGLPSLATTAPAIAATTKPASAPAVKTVKVAATKPASRPTTRSAEDLALETLKQSKLANPLPMADAFCRAGKPREAAILYQQAISDKQYANDKDWVMFQLAVCQEKDNPSASVELYGQLQTEFPKSTWAPMAKARLGVLQWMNSDEVKAALSGQTAPKETKGH